MIIEVDLTTANVQPLKYVNITGFDSISIDAAMLQGGTTFNTGVISIKKANSDGGAVSFGTPETITAPGLTELTLTDWAQANFLVVECTTAASAATRVLLTIHKSKLGFKLA